MELQNSKKPTKGSIKSRKRAVGRKKGLKEVLQQEGIKEQNLDQDILKK